MRVRLKRELKRIFYSREATSQVDMLFNVHLATAARVKYSLLRGI